MTTTPDQRLRRLADAYRTEPTVDAVAHAIIRRMPITAGENELGQVRTILSAFLERDGVLSAIERGDPWPDDVTGESVEQAATQNPAMPAKTLAQLVHADISAALRDRPEPINP